MEKTVATVQAVLKRTLKCKIFKKTSYLNLIIFNNLYKCTYFYR